MLYHVYASNGALVIARTAAYDYETVCGPCGFVLLMMFKPPPCNAHLLRYAMCFPWNFVFCCVPPTTFCRGWVHASEILVANISGLTWASHDVIQLEDFNVCDIVLTCAFGLLNFRCFEHSMCWKLDIPNF